MSIWQFRAAVEGHRKATAGDTVKAPTAAEYDAALEAAGMTVQ